MAKVTRPESWGAFPDKGRLKPQDEEFRRLRRENEVLRQERYIFNCDGHLLAGAQMKYRFLLDHRGRCPVRRMCGILDGSPSAYYAWRARPESPRVRENRWLVMEIQAIHRAKRGTYGSLRIHSEFKARVQNHGLKRVERLMREKSIRAKQRRRFKATTDSKRSHPVAANLLERDFETAGPNQNWVADIIYIPNREGWLEREAVLDLYSRMIVGCSMASRITRKLMHDTLEMAVGRRYPGAGMLVLHHSDRGSQCTYGDYQKALQAYGMICSMSRKGACLENAPMESFFYILQTEPVYHRNYPTRWEAKTDIFEYVEVFYKRNCRHSALGFLTPAKYEMTKLAA